MRRNHDRSGETRLTENPVRTFLPLKPAADLQKKALEFPACDGLYAGHAKVFFVNGTITKALSVMSLPRVSDGNVLIMGG